VAWGVGRGVEVGFGFGGQFEERTERLEDGMTETCTREHGIGDLTGGAKWQITESCPFGARHALAPSVKIPTADNDKGLGSGEADADFTWIASRSVGERAGVHLNFGYAWIGGPDDDAVHYGVSFDYQVAEDWQWVGELFAEKELASGADLIAQYGTGVRWTPTDSLTLDLAAGSGISGGASDFTATAGLTWTFSFTNLERL
jgi:hypothetical protein